MSENDAISFVTQLRADIRDDMTEFKADIRREYDRTRAFLITIIGVLLSAIIVVGFTHIGKDGETRTKVAALETKQADILEKAVSQESLTNIILSYDSQTKIMEEFLKEDVKEAVKEFNKVSSNFRSYIMMYQLDIKVRGAQKGGDGQYDSNK